MTSAKWLSEFETGVLELDRANRALMGLVAEVFAASETSDPADLRQALVNLRDQTKIGFAREDGLMDELKYQGAAQHQSEHRQFLAQIQDQIDDLDAGLAHAPNNLRFQKSWFAQHVVRQDILFGQAILTQQGIDDRRDAEPRTITEDEPDAIEDRRQGLLGHIVWTSKLDVGVEAIDAGHHAMVEIFNSVVDVSPSGDRTQLAALLEQLGNTIAADFEAEEKLMAQVDYEYSATHLKEHQELLLDYGYQVEDWRANHVSAESLCRFMHRWLLRHIVASDKQLGEAIQRQSGKRSAV